MKGESQKLRVKESENKEGYKTEEPNSSIDRKVTNSHDEE